MGATEETPLINDEAVDKRVHKTYDFKLEDGVTCTLCAKGFTVNNMYDQVPSVCFMGMQEMERKAEDAAVEYAIEMLQEREGGAAVEDQKSSPSRRETMMAVHNRVVREVTEAAFSWPLNLAVLVAVLAQLLVGYNIGVMNAPVNVVFPDHSTASWSLAVAAFAAGGPFGANISGSIADKRGRRSAILASAMMFVVGGLVQSLAPNMNMIIVARLIIGFASGFTSVVIPIYLGELAPPSLRGTLGTVTQFATVTGILVSNLLAFPLAKPHLWRFLFGVNVVIGIGILFLSPWLLESPRWLLQQDANSHKAREILGNLRNLAKGDSIETEVVHLLTATKAQGGGTTVSLSDLFTDPSYRVLMISAIVYHVAQQLSGINAVFYYSNSFFEGVIDIPTVGTAIVGAVNVAATYVALLVMESTDRRFLLIISSGGMMACSIILVLSLLGYLSNLIALGAVNLYVIFFELGLGPIPWLIVPELFNAKYVALAMSTATQINWVFSFLVGLVYPFLQESLGPYSFGPFAGFLFLTLLYTLFVLPETRGKTPTEIYSELVAKRPLKDIRVD